MIRIWYRFLIPCLTNTWTGVRHVTKHSLCHPDEALHYQILMTVEGNYLRAGDGVGPGSITPKVKSHWRFQLRTQNMTNSTNLYHSDRSVMSIHESVYILYCTSKFHYVGFELKVYWPVLVSTCVQGSFQIMTFLDYITASNSFRGSVLQFGMLSFTSIYRSYLNLL